MAEIPSGEIVVYEAPGGEVRVDVRLAHDTVWLSLNQMAELFGRDKSVISRHLRNVFRSGELERTAVVSKNATTAADGKTYQVEFFDLDVIISVGYRVNSKRGTQFRIWATRILRDHLIRGYTLNERRLAERGLSEIEQAVGLLARTLNAHALVTDEGRAVLDVVQCYSRSWRLLLEYDEERLAEGPGVPVTPTARLTIEEARGAVAGLREDLASRGEAGRSSARSAARRWPRSSARSSRPSTVSRSIRAPRSGPHTCSTLRSRTIRSQTATSASARCSSSTICGATGCSCASMANHAWPTTRWWRWRC